MVARFEEMRETCFEDAEQNKRGKEEIEKGCHVYLQCKYFCLHAPGGRLEISYIELAGKLSKNFGNSFGGFLFMVCNGRKDFMF